MSFWIPAHQSLARHPKVRRVARTLDVSHAEVIGRLMLLWWWATDYAPDGWIGDHEDVCDALDGVDGDWVDALVTHGLLDLADDGWQIHDWDEHAGRSVTAKTARSSDGSYGNHIRWHINQGRYNPDCPHCTADYSPDSPPDSPPDRHANRTKQTEHNTREQQQGEPTTEHLYEAARTVLAEREAAGYHVDNPAAFLAHLIKTEEVQHQARKLAWADTR